MSWQLSFWQSRYPTSPRLFIFVLILSTISTPPTTFAPLTLLVFFILPLLSSPLILLWDEGGVELWNRSGRIVSSVCQRTTTTTTITVTNTTAVTVNLPIHYNGLNSGKGDACCPVTKCFSRFWNRMDCRNRNWSFRSFLYQIRG